AVLRALRRHEGFGARQAPRTAHHPPRPARPPGQDLAAQPLSQARVGERRQSVEPANPGHPVRAAGRRAEGVDALELARAAPTAAQATRQGRADERMAGSASTLTPGQSATQGPLTARRPYRERPEYG